MTMKMRVCHNKEHRLAALERKLSTITRSHELCLIKKMSTITGTGVFFSLVVHTTMEVKTITIYIPSESRGFVFDTWSHHNRRRRNVVNHTFVTKIMSFCQQIRVVVVGWKRELWCQRSWSMTGYSRDMCSAPLMGSLLTE